MGVTQEAGKGELEKIRKAKNRRKETIPKAVREINEEGGKEIGK